MTYPRTNTHPLRHVRTPMPDAQFWHIIDWVYNAAPSNHVDALAKVLRDALRQHPSEEVYQFRKAFHARMLYNALPTPELQWTAMQSRIAIDTSDKASMVRALDQVRSWMVMQGYVPIARLEAMGHMGATGYPQREAILMPLFSTLSKEQRAMFQVSEDLIARFETIQFAPMVVYYQMTGLPYLGDIPASHLTEDMVEALEQRFPKAGPPHARAIYDQDTVTNLQEQMSS